MGLEKILAAVALSTIVYNTAQAEEETPSLETNDQPLEEEQKQEIEEYARKEVGGLAIKGGYSWTKDKRFITWAASLMLNSYLAEFRFRKQNTNILREDDELKIGDFTFKGERRYKAYQSDFTFGFEVAERGRQWYDLALFGQVTGGFQVVKNIIKIEGEDFPGDPDIDFFAGGGVRPEAVLRIPRLGRYYASIGLGGTLEYLFTPNDEFMRRPVRGLHYSAYALVRFSQENERRELRLKKE